MIASPSFGWFAIATPLSLRSDAIIGNARAGMRLLFIHQNCPGQYKHLARHLAARPGNEVVFITQSGKPEVPGVRKVEYAPARRPTKDTHFYIRGLEANVLNGQAVARAAATLKQEGFAPDVVCAHPSWGESLYIKDVFPEARLLAFCEFYYRSEGADVGFDPVAPLTLDDRCRVRTKNTTHLLTLETMDWGVSPTRWQRAQYPREFLDRISVIHDGIDVAVAAPDPAAALTLPNGATLTRADEVVTYVARNLEPYRGFPSFMRALPEICRRRPRAQVVIVGGDDVSYGARLPGNRTYRQQMLEEVTIDPARVHFLGYVPYEQYIRVLRVSSVHVYLTYPFVLSWSMMEAMAAECLLVASATPPVLELIEDGRNGLLVDFFSPEEIARRAVEALEGGERWRELRRAARRTILERFELRACLARHIRLIEDVAARRRPQEGAQP
jgi:glycosyltransferase involved in cell wall biosynthesis